MDESKRSSAITSVLTEILIAAILVILIVGALNYFSILPISQTFPALSFLPHQNSVSTNTNSIPQQPQESSTNNNGTAKNQNGMYVYKNIDAAKTLYRLIPDSSIEVASGKTIEAQMAITGTASESTGIIFSNNISDKNSAKLFLVSYSGAKQKSWILRYVHGDKTANVLLFDNQPGKLIFIHSKMNISADGKKIEVTLLPGGGKKTLILPDVWSGRVSAIVQVDPSTTLNISTFTYK